MRTPIGTCAETEILQCGTLSDVGVVLKGFNAKRVFIVCDTHTRKLCYPLLQKFLPLHTVVTLPEGEKNKTINAASKIWDALLKYNAGKDALLVALGGGVVTDITGFAASVYKRGIPVVLIPTTLLAQADAAIGGKTGLDYSLLKNALGSFYHPRAVLIHNAFLKTLPQRHLNNGVAELIKVGAAWDVELFYELTDKKNLTKAIINAAITAKCRIVNEDTRDNYLRHVLNFGHTLGHALESVFLTRKPGLLHGEAVAVGIVGEAYLSYIKAGMPIEDLDDILFALNKWNLLRNIDLKELTKPIIKFCRQDKKNEAGNINFVLLQSLGAPIIDVPVEENEIVQALIYVDNYLQSL